MPPVYGYTCNNNPFGSFSMKNPNVYFFVIYLIIAILLFVLGILYQTKVIKHQHDFLNESVWWYGVIGVGLIIPLFFVFDKLLQKSTNPLFVTYAWLFSHVLLYFTLTFISPGQWPFWLAIGILWEWYECYFSRYVHRKRKSFLRRIYEWIKRLFSKKNKIGCSGVYDIIANTCGISIAMWIHLNYNGTLLIKN